MKNKMNFFVIVGIILIIITLPQIIYAREIDELEVTKISLIYDENTIYKDPVGTQNKSSSGESLDNMIGSAEDFAKESDPNTLALKQSELQSLSSLLFNIILNIAVVVSVLVGLYIGIQFITGSVEQKANVKEMIMPYVIGCFVVYGALGIWKIVVTILQNAI